MGVTGSRPCIGRTTLRPSVRPPRELRARRARGAESAGPGPRVSQSSDWCASRGQELDRTKNSQTHTTAPAADADVTHRRHANHRNRFADLIDGPRRTCRRGSWGRTPPGCSARRSPTICCALPALLQVVGMIAPVNRRYDARSSAFPQRKADLVAGVDKWIVFLPH